MSKYQGKFNWYDLLTSDMEAAKKFYGAVLGWSYVPHPKPDGELPYHIIQKDGAGIGGVMPVPEEAKANGMRPCWMGYIMVLDVDDYAAKIQKAGGRIYKGPMDIPDVGRFAVCADPQGAGFMIFKGNMKEEDLPPPPDMDAAGFCGWRELYVPDMEDAFKFYADLFGWQKDAAFPMGPMGDYQIFKPANEDIPQGGMMNMPPQVPRPVWNFYFNVEDIDAAAERVSKNGGTVANGPMEVPGGKWIIHGFDPQGAFFALVGLRK